ncbi:sensor histidine kinase [Streptomyces sp. NBC_00102]|uniref:sensor histidine kinase n=1 Tax=Streptomyces sp. NBC_00102 TaxID=2975652 RepID=UPI002250D189|nr:sensor histidine kinase [Streptomyces sp. NBC_00102]MCX5399504.1 sensor histidine kinase [Streptomyces sp. NBC_00102]
MSDDVTGVGIGRPPVTRRQTATKMFWICVWLAFMSAPVSDLADGHHTPWATALGCLGLAAFGAVYLMLVFRHTSRSPNITRAGWTVALLTACATVLSLTLGPSWLVLFVYVSVSAGAVLPLRVAGRVIPALTALMAGLGLARGAEDAGSLVLGLLLPALLGGFAMTGVRQLVRTTVELREARATVAQLAANEERLRLARDLHDLLGHSLSLITLKSELAGRMLPGHPEQAALQVADIERVSRQALVDVRDAVTGYRRLTLPGELAGARTALAAAGITAAVPADAPATGTLPAGSEEALAWGLREAVTNVVRHSGARTCTVTLAPRQTLAGRFLELVVVDDGRGGAGIPSGIASAADTGITPGNGLTGLRERLAAVDGTLTAGPADTGRGFRLTLSVPLDTNAAGEHA